MRDIMKVIKFDFLTISSLLLGSTVFVVLLCAALSMILSPAIAVAISICSACFIIPLQGIADKNGFNKLYGTLPAERRNITMGRFVYIFLVFFITEIIQLAIVISAIELKLYTLVFGPEEKMPKNEVMAMLKSGFRQTDISFYVMIGVFVALCIGISYLEMIVQIHGKENQMKYIIITAIVLLMLSAVVAMLINPDSDKKSDLSFLHSSAAGIAVVGVVLNVLALVICLVFGEITAKRVSKREV